ncbi:MAG: TolC family protein [Proteobacteria bacterium]|nr:TolC family protein [Pseudomonadota bacterium]
MFQFFLILLVITSLAFPAKAETPSGPDAPTGSFARLLDKLRQHPEIAAYAQRAEASGNYAEGELGLPDPMLEAQVQDYPIGNSSSSGSEEKMIGFKQEIPAFGTRGARSEKGQAESRKNRLLGEYAFASMKAKLIVTLANRQRIGEQEKILDQQAGLFKSERASLKGRISANQAGASQLSLSQADSTEVEIMRAGLMEEKHEAEAMLTNMLGEIPEVSPPPVERAAWDSNPDRTYPVKVAGEDVAMAQKDVDLREAEYGPRFEVRADYGRFNNSDNAVTAMVGVSIPIWAEASQAPRLSGAKAALSSAKFDQDMARRNVIEKLNHLKAQIDTSAKKIELLEHKESLLSASSGAQTREYEAGKAEFVLPLKTRREALSVRYQLAAERAKRIALIADFNHYFVDGETR